MIKILGRLRQHAALLALLCIANVFSVEAFAHKLAPSLLQIDEIDTAVYQVVWRTPIDAAVSPRPLLPNSCRNAGASIVPVGTALEKRWVAECEGGLHGKTLAVELLAASRTVAMLRFQPLNGPLRQAMLTADSSSYFVPASNSSDSVFRQYIQLGITHILVGSDHLFFVTALLLLAGSWRVLLKTVSAFTLGHSVTLALVSLKLIPHWPALVEFSIAVTILILALELGRPKGSGPQTSASLESYGNAETTEAKPFIRRHQWLMASLFGLVHGLGFAGVLQEIGIPSGDVVSALLAFNVGIELGQIVFVGLVASVFYLLRRSSIPIYQFFRSASILAMGGFSVYWCLDRGSEILGQIL